MFEIRIVTADRNQVRHKRNLSPYSGPNLLMQTLEHIFKSDIDIKKVSIHNDNLKYDSTLPKISKNHENTLKYASLLGINVVQNEGGGFLENSYQTLIYPKFNEETEYIIILEDDVQVAKNIIQSCKNWVDFIKSNTHVQKLHFGTLFNTYTNNQNDFIVNCNDFWGAQALIFSLEILPSFLKAFDDYPIKSVPDMDYPKIVQNILNLPIICCYPSLVQHIGGQHTSWNPPHHANGDRITLNFQG